MGTHPIFESDFDCLTETVMKVYNLSRTAVRTLASTAPQQLNHLPLQFGLGNWWGYIGKVKKQDDIVPYNASAPASAPVASADNMTGIAIDEVTTSADRPEYQARMVANAANEPGWFKYLNAYKFRQDRGGHGTKLGLHLDDEKNHLVSDYVEMRDRLSDVDRQGYHYRIFKASHYASKMEVLPYDQWAPMSADHHYLNGVGRQYMAENDEKEIVDQALSQGSIWNLPPFSYATWARNFGTYTNAKNKIDDSVLRSQF